MKFLSLILWVGQFGFSVLFPLVLFLGGSAWLQARFSLGLWIVILGGILGLLTSLSTARSCLAALRKAADEAAPEREKPIAFNDHK